MAKDLVVLLLALSITLIGICRREDESFLVLFPGEDREDAGYVEIVAGDEGRIYRLSKREDDGPGDLSKFNAGDKLKCVGKDLQRSGNMSGGKRFLFGIPININKANIKDLEAIPGIGAKTAKSIVDFRETIGRFTTVNDLIGVKGIGKKRLEKIKPYVTI